MFPSLHARPTIPVNLLGCHARGRQPLQDRHSVYQPLQALSCMPKDYSCCPSLLATDGKTTDARCQLHSRLWGRTPCRYIGVTPTPRHPALLTHSSISTAQGPSGPKPVWFALCWSPGRSLAICSALFEKQGMGHKVLGPAQPPWAMSPFPPAATATGL
jgi:hypothetical protein